MTTKTVTGRTQGEGLSARHFRRKYQLQVVEGPDRGAQVVTAQERFCVGSAAQNDLVLADPLISRHHLRIEAGSEGYRLSDLGSTNGTIFGALRLREAFLDGPLDLRLGDTVLRFAPLADEEEVPLLPDDHFGPLVGRSAAMREVFSRLAQLARQDITVLVEGETGTGKELVAQALHQHSLRSRRPLVVLDCGSIPPNLIESELFGHRHGAFTGAVADRAGVFEEAHGGTLFLDEIGELDLALQPRLLRVLERREVKRIGDTRTREVDVRVVAATNRDLLAAVNQGTFRADLYYRLAVVPIHLPPLRERREDIVALVEHMLPTLARRLGLDTVPAVPAETLQQIVAHSWPGNVRELRNFLERLLTLSHGAALSPELSDELAPPGRPLAQEEMYLLPFREAKAHWTSLFDVDYLTRLLARCNHNVAEAARQSGIDRVHLFRLLKKYQLRRS